MNIDVVSGMLPPPTPHHKPHAESPPQGPGAVKGAATKAAAAGSRFKRKGEEPSPEA